MGTIVWLVVAFALWVWGGILAHANLTQPNLHSAHIIANPAFSPGAWLLAFALFIVGAACVGMAILCLYLRTRSDGPSESHGHGH